MRHFRLVVLIKALFALVGTGIVAPPAWAKESYKDEAGRIIYTIDDNGIVSMFENSPTDLTISVTRGTREEMQPQVAEINPDEGEEPGRCDCQTERTRNRSRRLCRKAQVAGSPTACSA